MEAMSMSETHNGIIKLSVQDRDEIDETLYGSV